MIITMLGKALSTKYAFTKRILEYCKTDALYTAHDLQNIYVQHGTLVQLNAREPLPL